jgi:hypothetical protein
MPLISTVGSSLNCVWSGYFVNFLSFVFWAERRHRMFREGLGGQGRLRRSGECRRFLGKAWEARESLVGLRGLGKIVPDPPKTF